MRHNLAVIGFGNRAEKYLKWVLENPGRVNIAAIVESDPVRLLSAKQRYQLSESACFSSADDFFAARMDIDTVIIATPDRTHYPLASKCIDRGWHVLLEKPAATSWEECKALASASARAKVLVSVCFVLRFYPYWQKFRELIHCGKLGRLLSIHHEENVGIDRYVHTFVRGLWSREEDSSPLLLSKCSHDMDLLVYLCDCAPARVASFGALTWFRKENAPKESSDRCESCPLERTCAFSAVDLYLRRNEWNLNFDRSEEESLEDASRREVHSGRWGRCAYKCDNNVVDHQEVLMQMKNGATVTLRLNCLTKADNRVTSAYLSGGEIFGDGSTIRVNCFDSGKTEVYDFSEFASRPLHGGADHEIVRDFFDRIDSGEFESLTEISQVLEGHRACFEAEEFRQNFLL